MSKAAVNGIHLYYEEEGQGIPLVLISGYTTDISAWDLIRHELAKHFRLILVDNRGAGRSDSPDIPYNTEIMAEDVTALMTFLRLENVYVLAHSMGTAIAQTIAIKNPKLIKKMVLANPLIRFKSASGRAFSYFLKMRQQGMSLVTMTEGVMPWLFSNDFLKNTVEIEKILQIAATYPYPQSFIGQKRQLEALIDFNSEEWFHKITIPTFIIEGEDDLICPGDAACMANEIPKAGYHIFPGQAHMEHIEKAKEFVDVIIKHFNTNQITII